MPKFLKEYRCPNCNKLFFKGDLLHGTIEIKCKNCKQFVTLNGKNCQLFLMLNKKAHPDNLNDLQEEDIEDTIIQCTDCADCEENEACEHFKHLKNNLCPLCKKITKEKV